MKNLEQLEQEAKQAIDGLKCFLRFENVKFENQSKAIIAAAISIANYQAEKSFIRLESKQQEITGDGSGESLPEVSQEERVCDGWRVWNGGERPIENSIVNVQFRNGEFQLRNSDTFDWGHSEDMSKRRCFDIIAYRIVKGE